MKQRYKSLLEIKKTIKNNIELIHSALKKLPKESQPKLNELVRLDTILNEIRYMLYGVQFMREIKKI